MKKMVFLTVILGLILSAAVFADSYVVEEVKGTVKREVKSGEWADVKKGDTLTEAAVIDIKLNSELTVKSSGKSVTIKKMQKGALSTLVASAGNTQAGVKIAGKAVDTNADAAGRQTANTSTASTRASSAAADQEWVE